MGEIQRALGAIFFWLIAVGCSRPAGSAAVSTESDFIVRGTQVVAEQRLNFEKAVLGLEVLDVNEVIVGYCTAVLIRPDVILTAAHCFDAHLVKGVDSARVQATTNLTTVAASDPDARRTVKIIPHPLYDSRAVIKNGARRPKYDHDLALAILDRPMDAAISPQPLIEAHTPLRYGQRVLVYGFGHSVDYNKPRNSNRAFLTLQRGIVTMSFETIDNRIVTAHFSNSSLCQGDSGGPGFFRPNLPGAVPTVVSINSAARGLIRLSSGRQLCSGSSVMQPIAPSRDWIDQVLRANGR